MGIEKIPSSENLISSTIRNRNLNEEVKGFGWWKIWHLRYGKIINQFVIPNLVTTAGKNRMLDCMFNEGTQSLTANWCGGLINLAGWTGYNVGDTMASHGGWTEWTAYTQANRVAWGQGAGSAGAISNASPMVFDINGTGTVKGLFICDNNTKGGSTGLLWSGASYPTQNDVQSGDQIRSIYGFSF
jgi:hypothetical protein